MALTRCDRLLHPTWVLKLTNHDLLKAHFDAMMETCGPEHRRTLVLWDEIKRRYGLGALTWTEWEAGPGMKWVEQSKAENERNHG